MSEFCPACGEIRAEQRSQWGDKLIWFQLGIEHDRSLAPPDLFVFCELCLEDLGNGRRDVPMLDEDTDNERYTPVTDIEIDRFLAKKLAEMALRIIHKLPVVRCQSIAGRYDRAARCRRYAARQLNGLWLCGQHCLPKSQPAVAYRSGVMQRFARAYVISGEPDNIVRQLRVCLPPDELETVIRLLAEPRDPAQGQGLVA